MVAARLVGERGRGQLQLLPLGRAVVLAPEQPHGRPGEARGEPRVVRARAAIAATSKRRSRPGRARSARGPRAGALAAVVDDDRDLDVAADRDDEAASPCRARSATARLTRPGPAVGGERLGGIAGDGIVGGEQHGRRQAGDRPEAASPGLAPQHDELPLGGRAPSCPTETPAPRAVIRAARSSVPDRAYALPSSSRGVCADLPAGGVGVAQERELRRDGVPSSTGRTRRAASPTGGGASSGRRRYAQVSPAPAPALPRRRCACRRPRRRAAGSADEPAGAAVSPAGARASPATTASARPASATAGSAGVRRSVRGPPHRGVRRARRPAVVMAVVAPCVLLSARLDDAEAQPRRPATAVEPQREPSVGRAAACGSSLRDDLPLRAAR